MGGACIRCGWAVVAGLALGELGLSGVADPVGDAVTVAGLLKTYVPPRGYVCYRATGPVRVDGRLDEAAWRAAPWTEDFVDIEGLAKPKPRLRTRAKLLWDDDYLYIGAELDEPHVWATVTRHDAVIFQDNDFEVFLDPSGEGQPYAEFEINALGTGWDLLLTRPYKDGGRPINGWDIRGLRSAVHVDGTLNDPRDTDRGWTVELAFPWKVLGELTDRPAPPHDGDHWRLDFSRVEWGHEVVNGRYRKIPDRREANWVWSPQGVVDMHRPQTWGDVQFSMARPGSARFQPDPAGPARHALYALYERQQTYRKAHGRWARTLAELRLVGDVGSLRLETTTNLFEASLDVPVPNREVEHWHIRQDARIWRE